jgi:hypothetical protein
VSSNVNFTPSASVSALVVPHILTTIGMPAVDAGNVDTMVTNSAAEPAYLGFGPATNVGADVAGTLVVPGGQTVLLTANTTVLSAAANNTLVLGPSTSIRAGAQPSVAAAATLAAGRSGGTGATLTITRGTASALPVWKG